jgi:hypothetical protein
MDWVGGCLTEELENVWNLSTLAESGLTLAQFGGGCKGSLVP